MSKKIALCFANQLIRLVFLVEILFDVTENATQLTQTVGGMLPSSAGTAMEETFFLDTVYFSFDPNDNAYPKFDNFIGYPRRLQIYYENGTDDCIQGMAFVYSNAAGIDVPQWVAGIGNFTSGTKIEDQIAIDQNLIVGISGITANQGGSFNCIAAIRFELVCSTVCIIEKTQKIQKKPSRQTQKISECTKLTQKFIIILVSSGSLSHGLFQSNVVFFAQTKTALVVWLF